MRRLGLAVIAAGIAVTGVAPAAHADVRVGLNYRLASDPGPFRGQDQVALAVNPANPKHVVAVHANYLTENCEGTSSVDGGVTWSEAAPLTPPTPLSGLPFQKSCRVSNHLGESMFQTVAFGSGQNVYATSITPRSAAFGEEGAAAILYKSTNGGVSWQTGVVAMAGGPSAATGLTPATGPYYELPTVAVDRGAAPGGADRVYVAARDTVGNGNDVPACPLMGPAPGVPTCPSIDVAVSNDGGQSFALPKQASPLNVATSGPDSSSQPVVAPDGSVSIAWRTFGASGIIQTARSTDGGQNWQPAVNVTNVTAGGRPSSSHVTPLASTGSSFPRMAVNPTNGNLYIVYNQGPPGPTGTYLGSDHFINPDSHVYFQRSLNSGATWSTPKLINDNTQYPGALTVQTRHPSVAVAPNGRIDIAWEDRRHWFQGPGERNCVHTHIACDDARLGDTYYSYSTDGGATFAANKRISDRSHNNDVGYDYRFGTGWGFGPQMAALGNGELLIGWMDPREGSFDTDTQDIYLAKVNFDASGNAPQSTVDQPDRIALSVALSKAAYPGGGESVMASTFATRNATSVVIVNENDGPGALAAGVLARANLSTVLLAPVAGLTANVKAEVARLNPAGAFVIGDSAKLSEGVVADLVAAGVDAAKVVRIAGSSDAATAAAIATRMDRRTATEKATGVPAFDAAVIANPASPDAAAAAGLAAARRLPILYVSGDSLPASTVGAMSTLKINKTLVVGNGTQITDDTVSVLQSPTRLGGADAYATSQAVAAESRVRGLPSNVVYVADGARPMDAALLGPVVGRNTGIMVLAKGPVTDTAAATAASAGLTGIDRFVVVRPTPVAAPPPPAPPPPPGDGGGTTTTPAVSCRGVQIIRRNASRSKLRAVTHLRLPCAGKLTVRATTRTRVNGKLRTIVLKTAIRRLKRTSDRSVRISLSSRTLRRALRRNGRLRISLRTTFTPTVLAATSKRSTRTITITVRKAK